MPVVDPGRVLVLDGCFAPLHREISPGQTVTWDASQAATVHTVTFNNLNSGDLAGTFAARFDQPGTYPFACAYHRVSSHHQCDLRGLDTARPGNIYRTAGLAKSPTTQVLGGTRWLTTMGREVCSTPI
jgi:hypothetical protein